MKEDFYDKLKELCSLYEKVKLSILLVENFDEKREMYIAPINQLRSTLDHIFKAIYIAHETEKCDYELKEAKEHMARAGYDALELLAGELGTSIVYKLQPYDTETLTNVFSVYYTEIKPKITEIQESVAKRRMERKTDADGSFHAYFDEIMELVEINKSVDKTIPSLQEYHDKRRSEKQKTKRNTVYWGIIIGVVSAIAGGFLLNLILAK